MQRSTRNSHLSTKLAWLLLLPSVALGTTIDLPIINTTIVQAQPKNSQGLIIQADTQEANSKTEVVTARGNVRLNYPARKIQARANLAEYYIKQKRIVLSGSVFIVQNGNTLEGESIVYLISEGKFIANPKAKQQVRSNYIVPGQKGPGVMIQSNIQEANSKTQIVTARGNVQVNYPARKLRAKANTAQYNIKQKQVVLSGNVLVVQEGNSLQGETITYLIDEGRFIAKQKDGMPVQSIYVLPDNNNEQ
jgi:lipopolysaccharide export system protein LptA